MLRWPDLAGTLGAAQWAVIGAVATRLYMPERATRDLDILVATSDFPAAEQRLAAAGWVRSGDISIGGSKWRGPRGEGLDLLHSGEPWCPEAIRAAGDNRDAHGLPIIPLPYLVLLKLRASRTIDIGDVTRMLGLADEDALARVRAVVSQFAPEDAEDLDALVALGRLEWGDQTWK